MHWIIDKWCLRRILNMHWSEFVTNDEIRSRTGQPFLSDTVRSRRLSFIGHLYRRTAPTLGRIITELSGPPDNWRRRIGRPRQSWLRTVEADLRPMNLELATAKVLSINDSCSHGAVKRSVPRGHLS